MSVRGGEREKDDVAVRVLFQARVCCSIFLTRTYFISGICFLFLDVEISMYTEAPPGPVDPNSPVL